MSDPRYDLPDPFADALQLYVWTATMMTLGAITVAQQYAHGAIETGNKAGAWNYLEEDYFARAARNYGNIVRETFPDLALNLGPKLGSRT